MAALVLRFLGGGKVYWGGAIITTLGAGGVTHHAGSGWGFLSGGRVGIIGVARESSVGSDSVVKFHVQFHKCV
jgi:hypothetical protein